MMGSQMVWFSRASYAKLEAQANMMRASWGSNGDMEGVTLIMYGGAISKSFMDRKPYLLCKIW